MQPFVAEGVLGAFDRRDFVGHLDDPEVLLQNSRHLVDLIFVKADDADTDQVGDVILDPVRLFLRFKLPLVLAVELLDALILVLDPPLDLGHLTDIRLLDHCPDHADAGVLGLLEELAPAVVVGQKVTAFELEVERGHRQLLALMARGKSITAQARR